MFQRIQDELAPSHKRTAATANRSNSGSTKHKERIVNFISVPLHLERFLFFGYLVCLDVFASIFSICPIKMLLSLCGQLMFKSGEAKKVVLIVLGALFLCLLDPSRLYHFIRGQSTVKLYVIFNVLDIADKLCSSFGLDILSVIEEDEGGEDDHDDKHSKLSYLLIAAVYSITHSTILFYQLITLNVAINSYSNALLALLVSNQFVEIKSAVFKKFDPENLFQLSCADVVERFQLSLYILMIAGLSSWQDFDRILFALAAVLISELLVDWLKHAFIGKFNHIHPAVYLKFKRSLLQELLYSGNAVGKRIGFSVIPFASIFIRLVYYFSLLKLLACVLSLWSMKLICSLLLHNLLECTDGGGDDNININGNRYSNNTNNNGNREKVDESGLKTDQ